MTGGTQEELEEFTRQLREQAAAMREVFDEVARMKHLRPTHTELLAEGHKWETWYAWRPVKDIHGCWHWLKEIYRLPGNTYADHDDWRWYHYGTIFDVIQNY